MLILLYVEINGDVICLTRRRSLAPCKTSAVADISVDMVKIVCVCGCSENDQTGS